MTRLKHKMVAANKEDLKHAMGGQVRLGHEQAESRQCRAQPNLVDLAEVGRQLRTVDHLR